MKPLRALALTGILALGACDIPTEAPILEQRWIFPVESTTIQVDELLPAGVTVEGGAFSVDVDPFATSRSLGDLCPTCVTSPVPVPAPSFSSTFSLQSSLPNDVAAAVVSTGSVDITVQNDFGFDPTAGGGSVTLVLTAGSGGRELGRLLLTSLPAGASTHALVISPGAVGGTISLSVQVASQGGQLTTTDRADRITVTATTQRLLVTSATVDVAGRLVELDQVDLDVEDIDDAIADRIESGSILLEITNPFGVGMAATVDIDHPNGSPITRTVAIAGSSTSTAKLTYSKEELRSFLGEPGVLLTGSGTVDSGAGTITVTPGQEVLIEAKFDVTLRIGG